MGRQSFPAEAIRFMVSDALRTILSRLESVQKLPSGNHKAACPVCARHTLIVAEKDDRLVYRCETGCDSHMIGNILQYRSSFSPAEPTWEQPVYFGESGDLPP